MYYTFFLNSSHSFSLLSSYARQHRGVFPIVIFFCKWYTLFKNPSYSTPYYLIPQTIPYYYFGTS